MKAQRVYTYRGVRYISKPRDVPRGWSQCGTCGRAWDDSKSTALTPTPSGRCPFEYWHRAPKQPSRRLKNDRFSEADKAAIAASDTPESTAAWIRGGPPLLPSMTYQGKLENAIVDAIANLGGFIDDEASVKLDELAEHIACHPESKGPK